VILLRLWAFHLQLAGLHFAILELQARTYAELVTEAGNP
jgi:hypothetical protein